MVFEYHPGHVSCESQEQTLAKDAQKQLQASNRSVIDGSLFSHITP